MVPEIIGRDHELSAIVSFLEEPAQGLRALVLEGQPGIGKSTLWLAGVAAARERNFEVLSSQPAQAERLLPNVVLGDLFGGVGPAVLGALAQPRRRALEAALLREEATAPIDPRALGAAILTLLSALAERANVLLAIDDDQWLDSSSMAALRFALRRSIHLPMCLLLARRLEDPARGGLEQSVGSSPEVRRLDVGPLSVGAIAVLLRQRRGVSPARPTLLRIHETSGGNPFYAMELATSMTSEGARLATGPADVPASIERLLRDRLRGFEPTTGQALLLVAAHGRLPVATLEALEVDVRAVEPAVKAAVLATSSGELSFTHPLLAAAAYHAAGTVERRRAHRRLAMVLDDPVQRARHLALAAVRADADLGASLEAAATVARQRGQQLVAAELGEHAVRLTPLDSLEDWHRRSVATARDILDSGGAVAAGRIAGEVLARSPGGRLRSEALVLRSELEVGEPPVAIATLEEALAEASGVPTLEASIRWRLADIGRFSRDRSWTEQHARAALQLAGPDAALRASALQILARLAFEHGDANALELAEEARRIAATLTDRRQAKPAAWAVGGILTHSGQLDAARQCLERDLVAWGDDELMRSELLWYLALAEFWAGRWTVAARYADESVEIASRYGVSQPTDHYVPALLALHRGEPAIAADHCRQALEQTSEMELPFVSATLAISDLWTGNQAAALARLQTAERVADARGWLEPSLRWWRAEYAEGLVQAGRVGDAEQLIARWERDANRLRRARVIAAATRCRGLIALARGEARTAESLLEDAAARHASADDPFGRARARLALGLARRRLRQKRGARVALDAARVEFEALGAMGWAQTAREELSRIGGRTRIEGLSASERSVAKLAALGQTNREIARTLFLSERTVASHLTHAYAKLGIRSRTELARRDLQRPTR